MKQHCVAVSALLCPARSHRLRVPTDTLLPPSCCSQLARDAGVQVVMENKAGRKIKDDGGEIDGEKEDEQKDSQVIREEEIKREGQKDMSAFISCSVTAYNHLFLFTSRVHEGRGCVGVCV